MKTIYSRTIEKPQGFQFARWSAGAKAFDLFTFLYTTFQTTSSGVPKVLHGVKYLVFCGCVCKLFPHSDFGCRGSPFVAHFNPRLSLLRTGLDIECSLRLTLALLL